MYLFNNGDDTIDVDELIAGALDGQVSANDDPFDWTESGVKSIAPGESVRLVYTLKVTQADLSYAASHANTFNRTLWLNGHARGGASDAALSCMTMISVTIDI